MRRPASPVLANAGGFIKTRPITAHNRRITDYCSYRGLLILSGIAADAPSDNAHIIRSDDGRVALWAGAGDDLWSLGKAVGHGGPWRNSPVQSGKPQPPHSSSKLENSTDFVCEFGNETLLSQCSVPEEGHCG